MRLSKFTPLTTFDIWQPRWHDKTVLLSVGKVRAAKTKYLRIIFSKTPSMDGDWVIDTTQVKKHKKETNGTIQCYVVPLSELLPLEVVDREPHEVY